MCGIFGFICQDKGGEANAQRVLELAAAAEARGRDAWGVAWLSRDGRLKSYKRPGPVRHGLSWLEQIVGEAVALVGHCRWATLGSAKDNQNNHPHACDGGWLVHNGTVTEARELARDYDLRPSTDCDSEVLARLVEALPGASMRIRVERAVRIARTYSRLLPQSVALVTKRHLVVHAAGKPVIVGSAKRAIYFCSVAAGMPRERIELAPGQTVAARWIGGRLEAQLATPEPDRPLLGKD